MRADEAIQHVKEKRPGSIQATEQEAAIREFEKVVIKDP
jgi:protein-tyrosine phosphatase